MGKELQFETSPNEWISQNNTDILIAISEYPTAYAPSKFRIKPEPQIVRADVTYVVFGASGNCTVDLSCENTETKQMLFKMAQQRERVVILSEECYNNLLGNSALVK